LPETNTLACYKNLEITAVKSFIGFASGSKAKMVLSDGYAAQCIGALPGTNTVAYY
jgi:hypothetical protein